MKSFSAFILDPLVALNEQNLAEDSLSAQYPSLPSYLCMPSVSEPEKEFDVLLRSKPKDEEVASWRMLLVRRCQRMVIKDCKDAVSLAESAKNNEVSLCKDLTKDDSWPTETTTRKFKGSLAREKRALKRKGSEESEINIGAISPRKKQRSDIQTALSTSCSHLFHWVDKAVATIDKILIVAGEFIDRAQFLDILQNIEDWIIHIVDGNHTLRKEAWRSTADMNGHDLHMSDAHLPSTSALPETFPTASQPVPEINPALAIARNPYSNSEARQLIATYNAPLIITHSMTQWPAMSRWKSPAYWYRKTVGGRRVIPIELGHKYTDEKWSIEFMTFDQFLQHHMLRRAHVHEQAEITMAYLAQHDIFAQIPSLQRDITIPDECYTPIPKSYIDPPHLLNSASQRPGDDVEKNIWMGPAGTISPLHYDPYHNVLCQVVGTKYIRLYAPDQTPSLYPHKEGLMQNTSQVDVEASQRYLDSKFPMFKRAKYVEGYLRAGEMLWLPKGWWHYVRSVEAGISLSFWWS